MTIAREFAPIERIDGDDAKGLVLLADHAMRHVPDTYGTLGLPLSEFDRHIAYDIGIEALTRRLAALTGAPAVMARFSRLLIDPNRGEDDPTLIRQIYDRTIVPGNYPLNDGERDFRLRRFYRPYHQAVAAAISDAEQQSGRAPLVIALHSFTPRLGARIRPWHAGILWDADPRAARPLIEALREDANLVVGDNEPYDGALPGDTMSRHCTANGISHALVEIRQDLIGDALGVEAWAQRLATILDAINDRPDIHVRQWHGSRTGGR
jgi:predicted N-formylglutamate amidohydrolase